MTWTKYATFNYSGNMTGLLQYENVLTGGYFYQIIVMAVFIIVFAGSYRWNQDIKKSFVVSSWVSGISSIFLFSLGLVPGYFMTAMALLICISIALELGTREPVY